MRTKSAYSTSDARAANVNCSGENSGVERLVVNEGTTRLSVANVATVASALAVPSALNDAVRWRRVATSSDSPRIPLQVIMTAANTVSRASVDASSPPATISVTMRATSITVTATASTNEPNGSPTRCATISAWWTAASTAVPSNAATITSTTVPGFEPHVTAVRSTASTGTTVVQDNERGSDTQASLGSVGGGSIRVHPRIDVVRSSVIAQVRFCPAEGRRWVRRAPQGAALHTMEDHDTTCPCSTLHGGCPSRFWPAAS